MEYGQPEAVYKGYAVKKKEKKVMFNKKFKSVFACFTAAAISCGMLAGCGGGKQETASSGAAEGDMDPFGKYDPPIEITYSLKSSAAQKFLPGEDYENNIWTKLIEEKLGIKLKIAWDADSATDAYSNKMNLCLASKDLPDFFAIDAKQYASAAQSGLLYDMTEIFEQYASDRVKQAVSVFPEAIEASKINDRLYAIPQLGGTPAMGCQVWWIREDWREKLNLPEPQNFNDIVEICRAFVEQDPDGNGKNDTYGMALQKDLYGSMGVIDGVGAAYGAMLEKQGVWYKDDSGSIVYGGIQPSTKEALQALQDMYKDGLIDNEFGVKDSNKISEDIINGKIGVMCGPNWHCLYPFGDLVKKDSNARFKAYPLMDMDGPADKVAAYWPIWQYFGVSANCEHPEAIVKIMNLQKEMCNEDSTQDVYEKYERKDDVEISKLCPYAIGSPDVDFKVYEAINNSIQNNDKGESIKPAFRKRYENVMKYINNGDLEQYGIWGQLGPGGSMGILHDYADRGAVVTTEVRGVDTPTMTKYRSTLANLELEVFSDIIKGGSIDQFDKFVEDWKKLGGTKMEEEINNLYNK